MAPIAKIRLRAKPANYKHGSTQIPSLIKFSRVMLRFAEAHLRRTHVLVSPVTSTAKFFGADASLALRRDMPKLVQE